MLSRTQYSLKMVLALLAYGGGLIVMNRLSSGGLSGQYWLVALPVLPLIYMAKTILEALTSLDEMWRKILMEALAFSGIATGFTCFSYLFIRDMGGVEFRAEWAFYLMWFYYGIGSVISARRYQ
ncbi:hypothetical protein SAMN02745166_04920 [Prosthecobacter debontii]|uniref:Uncharacterized protein n=1 Tax=Prosthecobacter debontii TaxID=48467 RepID=A0A1T4Z2V9_9BACT|nr:hypothetical protein [Prosthecobacter debontii]SKB08382.1 hypothetical protein SAMN02745166_04920 [Prosthecobacter debontii]